MKVGIALAAYAPDPLVFSEQLASIQNQIHTDWICVITLDSSLSRLREEPRLSRYFEDPRFIWIENQIRLGHKKNFEKAIQAALAHGVPLIACSDQDDIWYSDKLSVGVEACLAQGPGGLVHSDMHLLKGNRILEGTAWKIEHRGIQNHLPRHLLVRNIVAGCSMIFDADLARRYPIIPDGAEYHDHWYALVASYYGGIGAIDRPLYAYRQHEKNEVGVTPFNRIFTLPSGLTVSSFFKKCRLGWLKSRAFAQSAQNAGLPLSFLEKWIFLFRFDLGIGLLLLGILNLKKDPPLARASIARSIGKAISLFG